MLHSGARSEVSVKDVSTEQVGLSSVQDAEGLPGLLPAPSSVVWGEGYVGRVTGSTLISRK